MYGRLCKDAAWHVVRKKMSGTRERERQNLRTWSRAQITATAGGDDDVLALILAEECHRYRVGARRQLRFPQLPAGARIERAESTVDRRADENQAARSGDAAADVERTGVGEPF